MDYACSTMSVEPAESLRSNQLLSRVWEAMGRPAGVVTGGFVRDTLLGRPTTDLDFALAGDVDSVAESARRLADAHATRPHLLGRKPRAVWRVATADLKIELWPLGTLTVEDDILRRDFTCNALAWRLPDGPLIDLVGGLEHLAAGRLAAVSRGNLQDDPLPREKFTLYPHDNLSRQPRMGKLDSTINHMGNFFDCIKSRNMPISDVVSQHRSVSLCHLANISMRLGRKLTWDPEKELFVGDDEANNWLSRKHRTPYEVTG